MVPNEWASAVRASKEWRDEERAAASSETFSTRYVPPLPPAERSARMVRSRNSDDEFFNETSIASVLAHSAHLNCSQNFTMRSNRTVLRYVLPQATCEKMSLLWGRDRLASGQSQRE